MAGLSNTGTSSPMASIDLSRIDSIVLNSPFLQTTANKSLRITCYGSSSSDTPESYMKEARSLGYILAKRGHVCINGAGAYGCMAAMNDGAMIGEGHVIGVIHEMWLKHDVPNVRDGGAHPIFTNSTENASGTNTGGSSSNSASSTTPSKSGSNGTSSNCKYEMLVAKGSDLQERKRLLVDKTNALVVLPGGPGTWDELWEMVCARGIGLSSLPVIVINCNQYYDPFYEMLVRAYNDKLTKYPPNELIHFVTNAEEAVQYIESICIHGHATTGSSSASTFSTNRPTSDRTKNSMLRTTSIMHTPIIDDDDDDNNSTTIITRTKNDTDRTYDKLLLSFIRSGLIFTLGIVVGTILSSSSSRIGVRQSSAPTKQ